MSQIYKLSITEEIKNLTEAYYYLCQSQNTFKGLIPKDFEIVSSNLMKLINVKTSFLISECISVKPLT